MEATTNGHVDRVAEMRADLARAEDHLTALEARPLNRYTVRGRGGEELSLVRSTVSDLRLKIQIATGQTA